MQFTFEKKGVLFEFKSPKLNQYDKLVFLYKVKGYKENKSKDGFFANAEYNEKIYTNGKTIKDIITFYPFEIKGQVVRGVSLPEPYATKVNNLYKSLLAERERIFDETVSKIVKGDIPISFSIVGCDYPHYQAWVNEIPSDLEGQEQRLMEKAVSIAYGGDKYIFNPVDFLNNKLKQSITTKEGLHKKAFNLRFDKEKQDYYSYKDTVVTGFDMKLTDIIEVDIEKYKELLRKYEERNKLKDSMVVKIIKQGKARGSDGDDFYADVVITDKETKESLEFCCRNIFDFGYVVNPNYEIAKGKKGGLRNGDTWETFKQDEGWVKVRDLTEFEKKCLDYLNTFPPIYSGIRL